MKRLTTLLLITLLLVAGTTSYIIKDIQVSKEGTQITFKNNTGYWFEGGK